MKLYLADFQHGEPSLNAVDVVKETEKTYCVDYRTAIKIIGWRGMYHKVLNKEHPGYALFTSEDAALDWLIDMARQHREAMSRKVVEAAETIDRLIAIKEQKGQS